MVTSSSDDSVFENNGAGHGFGSASDSFEIILLVVTLFLRLPVPVLAGLRLFAVILETIGPL